MNLSVTAPLEKALQRAKIITFQPFDLGKWFTLGFTAWLATLGESGASFHFNIPGGGFQPGGGGPNQGPINPFKPIWDWLTANWSLAVAIAAAVVASGILLSLLLLWLRSRAAFVFLENLALNETAIVAPWKYYGPLGDSLFWFWLGLSVVALIFYAAIAGLALAVAWPDIQMRQFGGHAMTGIFLGFALLLPLAIFFALVGWCTNNFIVPLMYLRRQTVLAAWQEFRSTLLPGNVGYILLFLLMQLLVRFGIGIISAILGCLTCCIGFFPYLNAVVTLPLLVFDRCYSIYFLEQFGPDYSILVELLQPPDASRF
jgi:hypothetical protein